MGNDWQNKKMACTWIIRVNKYIEINILCVYVCVSLWQNKNGTNWLLQTDF